MVNFPIDLNQYKKLPQFFVFEVPPAYLPYRLKLDPTKPQLTAEQKQTLQHNIQLLRDVIVLFTATGSARGVSGHTGSYICSMILAEIYPSLPPPLTF